MKPRYNTAPVHPEKIQLIQSMLNSPLVKQAWDRLQALPHPEHSSERALREQRKKTWDEYCFYRDQFLGLPPLQQVEIVDD